ncbi:hypothetical protein K474DRAFT_1707160 [Panus rudis PR-1116 ss-1]|nr:hypothetical protein K474DRAFT_1707160 [Panus rudis PR-1116 ss-1]
MEESVIKVLPRISPDTLRGVNRIVCRVSQEELGGQLAAYPCSLLFLQSVCTLLKIFNRELGKHDLDVVLDGFRLPTKHDSVNLQPLVTDDLDASMALDLNVENCLVLRSLTIENCTIPEGDLSAWEDFLTLFDVDAFHFNHNYWDPASQPSFVQDTSPESEWILLTPCWFELRELEITVGSMNDLRLLEYLNRWCPSLETLTINWRTQQSKQLQDLIRNLIDLRRHPQLHTVRLSARWHGSDFVNVSNELTAISGFLPGSFPESHNTDYANWLNRVEVRLDVRDDWQTAGVISEGERQLWAMCLRALVRYDAKDGNGLQQLAFVLPLALQGTDVSSKWQMSLFQMCGDRMPQKFEIGFEPLAY